MKDIIQVLRQHAGFPEGHSLFFPNLFLSNTYAKKNWRTSYWTHAHPTIGHREQNSLSDADPRFAILEMPMKQELVHIWVRNQGTRNQKVPFVRMHHIPSSWVWTVRLKLTWSSRSCSWLFNDDCTATRRRSLECFLQGWSKFPWVGIYSEHACRVKFSCSRSRKQRDEMEKRFFDGMYVFEGVDLQILRKWRRRLDRSKNLEFLCECYYLHSRKRRQQSQLIFWLLRILMF